jgi:hypothetical protein
LWTKGQQVPHLAIVVLHEACRLQSFQHRVGSIGNSQLVNLPG